MHHIINNQRSAQQELLYRAFRYCELAHCLGVALVAAGVGRGCIDR